MLHPMIPSRLWSGKGAWKRPLRLLPGRAGEIEAWRRARATDIRLTARIMHYANARWGELMCRVASRFFLMGQHPAESGRCLSPVFWRWFAFTWIPDWRDDLEANDREDIREGWPTAPLGVSWLAAESPPVTALEERFIVTAAESPCSMLLVESVSSGWFVTVRDLLTGRRFRVVDPEVSASVQPDEIVFSAVLTLDGVSTFLGAAPRTIPVDYRPEIREVRRVGCDALGRYADDEWLTRAELLDLIAELCETYCEAYEDDRVIEVHTCGDPREPILLRWAINAPFPEALDLLRRLSEREGDRESIEIETSQQGEPHARITWYRRGPETNGEDWIVGFMYLDEGRLAATVPTLSLAERLAGELRARLGAKATLVEIRRSVPGLLRGAEHDKSWDGQSWGNSARRFVGRFARKLTHWSAAKPDRLHFLS